MLLNLTNEMARAGLSRRGLAFRLGLSERALGNRISGKTDFSLKQMLAVQSALPGLSMDELFAEVHMDLRRNGRDRP